MYAIVHEGGRQYKVEVGQKIRVNRLPGYVPEEIAKEGDNQYVFKNVVLVRDDTGIKTGKDILSTAKVTGIIVSEMRDKKIIVFKKKRRKGYHKTKGHRQDLSVVEITGITLGGIQSESPSTTEEDSASLADGRVSLDNDEFNPI
jgi:large subunit ribosomal protein L21